MRKRIVEFSQQALFALNVLIVFFLIFDGYLEIPGWLQVLGRMHPMFVHFPIVILLLAIVLDLVLPIGDDKIYFRKTLIDGLFLLGALMASLTVVMGLFLSQEEEYSNNILQVHKWSGVGVAALALLIVYVRGRLRYKKTWVSGSYVTLAILTIVAGHLGSELTHGQDFLWGPLQADRDKEAVALEDALVFNHVIKPVLEARCMNCHNERKAKGDLVMEDSIHLERGGKDGLPFVRGDAEQSLLIRRINFPEDHKKHMPPLGKPQLTEQEQELLYYWIKSGAYYSKRVVALEDTDTLRRLAELTLKPTIQRAEPVFQFAAARKEDIQSLQTDYRVIYPLAYESPALGVDFYNRESFTGKSLRDLEKIRKQIISLNLSKMPVTDEDLKTIARFDNLQRLNLNFTEITGSGLKHLSSLGSLMSLSLSGTKVNSASVQNLRGLKKLEHIYLWNTRVDRNDMKLLERTLAGVTLEIGFDDKGLVLKLNPPAIDNRQTIFNDSVRVSMSHPIKGTVIRYTIDGSDPDSLLASVYNTPILLEASVTVVRSKAYKEGWKGSDAVERDFLKSTFKPDSIQLITPPAIEYRANGAGILMDGQTGNVDFKGGGWLGFREKDAEVLFFFKKPIHTSSITLSTLKNTASFIFPPAEVEVWGAMDNEPMAFLGRWRPTQPTEQGPALIETRQFTYAPMEITRLKIISRQVNKLPAWHPGKGERAWVFLDEILVN
jgi:uncharacterized membrane protein